MTTINNITGFVDVEGRELHTHTVRLTSTSIKVTWSIPVDAQAYRGALVVASLQELNPSNYPTDGVKYIASSDWGTPAHMLGAAHVVGAFYDDMTTSSVTIENLPIDEPVYVSVHLTTSVRTYNTVGQHAYPESGLSEVWAGSMDMLSSPPSDPVKGQTYYDLAQKLAFTYDGAAWFPVSSNTTFTGDGLPTVTFATTQQNYSGVGNGLISGLESSTNPATDTWTIMAVTPTVFTVTGTAAGIKPSITVGVPYDNGTIRLLINPGGIAFMPGDTFTIVTAYSAGLAYPPGYPKLGDFFYDNRTKKLYNWDGSKFIGVEAEKGEPTYTKLHIGTTGETSARELIKDIIRRQLGYPQICVELDEGHFEIALNNAIQEYRRRSDNAYHKQFFFMKVQPHQQTYYLNDPTSEMHKIVDVIKVHRVNTLGLVNFGPDNLYAQQFLNHFYAPGVGYDLVSIHLIHALSETYSQLFAGDIGFTWREPSRELTILRNFGHGEKVLVECSVERPEQELLIDRWAQQWIQAWTEAEAMFILAHIRGKFQSVPGPGGGLSMNASDLISEAQRIQDDCLRQMKDLEAGNYGSNNMFIPMVIG